MKPKQARRLVNCCLPKLLSEEISSSPGGAPGLVVLDKDDTVSSTRICGLWSGMGSIYRLTVDSKTIPTTTRSRHKNNNKSIAIAVKHIPSPLANPSNASSRGDRRKAEAYQVEANFYEFIAPTLQDKLRLPACYYMERNQDSITMCLEWINGSFVHNLSCIQATLSWLAALHSAYWGLSEPDNSNKATENSTIITNKLQSVASYWHLDTRPDEHADMVRHGWQGRLRSAARAIDACLKRDSMQCLIHGDVKDANVLYNNNNNNKDDSSSRGLLLGPVTLVDFQYCGRGPPTRDLAYFFASSVDVDKYNEDELLAYYHRALLERLPPFAQPPPTLSHLKDSLEVAYCDFLRFQCGWGIWGRTPLSGRAQAFLSKLDRGVDLKSEEAYDKAIRAAYW